MTRIDAWRCPNAGGCHPPKVGEDPQVDDRYSCCDWCATHASSLADYIDCTIECEEYYPDKDLNQTHSGSSLIDWICSDADGARLMSYAIRQELQQKLNAADCVSLSKLERAVLTARWGLDSGRLTTLADVARRLDISKEEARLIERRVLEKLQQC